MMNLYGNLQKLRKKLEAFEQGTLNTFICYFLMLIYSWRGLEDLVNLLKKIRANSK